MNEIKKSITQILISNGFSQIIPLKERKYQIDIAENILFAIWVIASISFYRKLFDVLFWILVVICCLIVEQIISIVVLRIRHSRVEDKKAFRTSAAYLKSTSRSIYERVNLLFFLIFLFFQAALLPSGQDAAYSAFGLGGALAYLLMLSFDNSVLKNSKNRNSLAVSCVSLGLELYRGWRQVISITNRGITFAISGVFLGVLLGSISQEFWLLIGRANWLNLMIILGLLFLFAIIPSSSHIDDSVEHEIGSLKLDEDVFTHEKLFSAIVHRVRFDETRKLSRVFFDEYKKMHLWKLGKPIYRAAFDNLSNEMKNRAKWLFWISLTALLPLVFVLTASVTILVFPSDILTGWTGKQVSYDTSNLTSFFLEIPDFVIALNLRDDPILKFSAVLTVLVLAYFANNYSQDSRRVFTNLHVDKFILNDLIIILCGYYALGENEFQRIGYFFVPSRAWGYPDGSYVPIYLIPDNSEKSLVEKVITTNTTYEDKICAIFAQKENFLKSATAISMGFSEEKDVWQTSAINQQSRCWIGLGQVGNTANLYEFNDFEVAREWLENNELSS